MPPPGSGSLYFLNPKGKVHILASPDGQVFKCGRKWKSSMISVKSLGKGAETCSQCDPSAFPIKTKADLIEAINRKLQTSEVSIQESRVRRCFLKMNANRAESCFRQFLTCPSKARVYPK